MHEAKSNLSRLVRAVESGQEVIIERGGVPVARLTPYQPLEDRKLGIWKGQVEMSEDFDDELDPEDLSLWNGG